MSELGTASGARCERSLTSSADRGSAAHQLANVNGLIVRSLNPSQSIERENREQRKCIWWVRRGCLKWDNDDIDGRDRGSLNPNQGIERENCEHTAKCTWWSGGVLEMG